jgi:predicted  nucleic acid-binding Zn-ribbon protein
MGQVCKKCGYERQASDAAPDTQCPQCGAIYAKVEQHNEALKAEAAKKAEAEAKKKATEEYIKQQLEAKQQAKKEKDLLKRQVVVKTYKGSQERASELFQADAAKMAADGYFPTSQSWAPGSYGCGSFIVALLLCVVFIGIIIFIYMLLVKPAGTLSVTYERRSPQPAPVVSPAPDEKACPQCAEYIKAAAKICRFCGYKFE